ncbi:serine/threonine protein kinase [Thermobaculum terrenum ATCC BAA-798]|uniref:non-specific serine/threonine protein kinase n=1 Tax=Thermobaculum terrenum (strain ATCC BAA-798 / CCMEE 7001 / YNP1) TaxID=525904 RepID=D1CCS4_THET1|nr:protein kinase [Thermobaculum terrenum]ACZ42589.1 serine/threonine protein kinase [Thermobaculum terrenum ATCC BAA-798]
MELGVIGGRYEVEWKVGQGGAAEVYRAVDLRLGRVVALKVLRAGHAQDEKFRARFINEARAAARLSHPNIVDVYDYDEVDGTYFIAMEYVDGKNLKEYIRERGRLSEGEAIRITEQILEGLSAAHRAGLVHRDMKPQNVMVTEGGVVKITDFGIAKAVGDAGMTEAGVAFGTPHYLSPEQARGDEVTPRSDVYAVGVMMYEMLSGRLPFEGENPMRVAYAHVFEEPEGLREVAPWVSEGLVRVVERAMAKDPLERYGDAGEMLRDLRNLPLPADSHYNQDASSEPTVAVPVMSIESPPSESTRTASVISGPRRTSVYGEPEEESRSRLSPAWLLVPLLLLGFLGGCLLMRNSVLSLLPGGAQSLATPTTGMPPIVVTTGPTSTPIEPSPTPASTPTPVLPSAPENLRARLSPDGEAVELTWTDTASNETAYLVERSTDNREWFLLSTLAANSNSFTDNTISPGKKYYYRVRARGPEGYSDYALTSIEIPKPTPVPTNTPTPTPTFTPTPTPTPTPTRERVWMYAATTDYSNVNMRQDPDPNSPRLITIPYGARVRAFIPAVEGGDGNEWYEVIYRGIRGYVLADLLTIQAPPPKPTPTPTPTPTTEPTPTPTREPTPTPTPRSTPARTGSVSIRLEDSFFRGGWSNEDGYKGRSAQWIYGQRTQYWRMSTRFVLWGDREGMATLKLVGMDSEDSKKTRISILINDQEIFRGPDPLPNDTQNLNDSGNWGESTITFPSSLLNDGNNTLEIQNLEKNGGFGRPPWFMLDYAVVSFNVD